MTSIDVIIADGTTETPVTFSTYSLTFTETPLILPKATADTQPWTTNESATGFTLHVLNPPFGEELTLTCYVIDLSSTSTEIPRDSYYGTLTSVKRLCNLKQADTTNDTDLVDFLNKASSTIDTALETYEETLPLTSVPGDLAFIAELYAAGIYMQKCTPSEPQHPYTQLATQKLSEYLKRFYEEYTVTDAKTKAETALIGKQGLNIDGQTTKAAAETLIIPKQGTQIDAETAKIAAETTKLSTVDSAKITAEAALLAQGPVEAESYRNAKGNYDAWIIRDWKQCKKVVNDAGYKLTGLLSSSN